MRKSQNTRELIEYIVRSLVNDPSAVRVREVRNDRNTLAFVLHVASDDVGKVIGRGGCVANAIRALLRVRGTLEGRHISLEVH
jgi:predicted RNA-binding protein YlqC (UPF0109 family)